MRVWDLTTGTQLHQLPGHTRGITALAVTTLESHPIAITGSSDGDATVRVWDLTTGGQLHQLPGHTGGITALAVTTLNSRPIAITGSSDGTVRVWDLNDGVPLSVVGVGASVWELTPSSRNLLIIGTPMGVVALRLHRQQG